MKSNTASAAADHVDLPNGYPVICYTPIKKCLFPAEFSLKGKENSIERTSNSVVSGTCRVVWYLGMV